MISLRNALPIGSSANQSCHRVELAYPSNLEDIWNSVIRGVSRYGLLPRTH